ncbi:pantetheine-phosphate adenylyltransferase [Lactobacillaceae bacterium Scapto_B20]
MTKALFAGSFDPVTNGHLDIIERASRMFNGLVVVVGNNTQKHNWISATQRVKLIEQSILGLDNVSVMATDGLIIDLFDQLNADVLIRGVRNNSDFDAEKSLATFNRQLNVHAETLLIPTKPEFEAISSSRIKELYKYNRQLDEYLPTPVVQYLNEKRDINE